ncbi:MAG: hypothetical protein CVV21_10580 [Candidatus Goldiibacteriota bacterium HGW-Goldbacteria-1]|jgi:phosphatidylinositol alpha-mannosyltransferase|nr:MAG: hypothetical protein CVV21_10580 [Candidatus Goldiibacteriota bacterium HGW-Goldbacteria-1]
MPDTFKKIAIVTPYYYPLYGGVQEYVYHLKKEYQKLGYFIKVITSRFNNGISEDEKDVIRIGRGYPITVNGSTGRIILMRDKTEIKKALDEYNFDIIHYQEPFVPFLSHEVIKYSKALNIATFHANFTSNIYYRAGKLFISPLWKKLHGKIAVSPSAKSSISRYFDGTEVEIIPNGVSTSRFSPIGDKIEKFNDGMLNILFTGRIEKRKGLVYLIKAYEKLKKTHSHIRLIVVGRGPLMPQLQKYIKKHAIKDIFFEGFVSTDDLPKYYRTAQIYCSPALFGESFGIVLLEAMSAGVPVVAFNISGYNDVVSNMDDGFLAQPRDVHDLSQKLEILITKKPIMLELGARGRIKAKRHAWPEIAKKNLEFYKTVWNKKLTDKTEAV